MNIQPKIIVCIDDDSNILTLAKTILESGKRFHVHTFENGNEALKKIPSLKPDLIILDMLMPEIDGIEMLRALLSSSQTKNIPIGFMTAHANPDDLERYKEMGVNGIGFISKPINVSELPHNIEMLIELSGK
jgi:CheY-like chemotaxis protein